MRSILRKLALALAPVALYFAWFLAFEPNNYFGLRQDTPATTPVARVRAYEARPGRALLLGDSRLAHLDMEQLNACFPYPWQNLAFGGASLGEVLDLAEHVLDTNGADRLVVEASFYTLNTGYNTDRMSALETTLRNPLAYCLNLEYNLNAFTAFTDYLAGRVGGEETGDWVFPADYTDPASGEVYALHTALARYPAVIRPRVEGWQWNTQAAERLVALAERCQREGVALAVVLPPMASNVRALCRELGIDKAMQRELPGLRAALERHGAAVLDYEWGPAGQGDFAVESEDTGYFDGFHLDTRYGLPLFTERLAADVGAALAEG